MRLYLFEAVKYVPTAFKYLIYLMTNIRYNVTCKKVKRIAVYFIVVTF